MTEKREFYAATVQEAVERASSETGVSAEDLNYQVVDEGSAGFLGIGARDARIEIEVAGGVTTDDADETPEAEIPVAPAPEPAVETTSATGPAASETPPVPETSVPKTPASSFDPGQETEEEPPASIDQEVLNATEELTASILDAMGFQASLDVYDAGGFVAVDVSPDNTALFIGQKGETIDALQYLVNASINRGKQVRTRVVLDAEGYRQRRVEALQGMAHRTARRVVRERRPVEMPPMNPAERRVVHLYLKDNPGVSTESEGNGDSRRVRVFPA